MKIIVARTAGFCMGVKRAIEMAQKAARTEGGTIYTHGPLIHNPQELERLRLDGIVPLDDTDLEQSAVVVIRAHGVGAKVIIDLERDSHKVLDATCPKVSQIQKRIHEFSRDGYTVVIVGEANHPEVVGLVGHAEGPTYVIRTPEEVDKLPDAEKLLLVSQTTQDEDRYAAIKARFLARYPNAEALSTICSSSTNRQAEVRELVEEVDAMVIVGGKNSANTKRLYAISCDAGVDSYHVEDADELPLKELKGKGTVAIVAGASTPDWIIEQVAKTLEEL
jgi:(E)-4-hydroxy-3-methyl-but-2-enyl pyrophosphate reductase